MKTSLRKNPRRGRWSVGELANLRDLYGVRSLGAIARTLGRPVPSVSKMAERLFRGPRKHGPWSASETQALKRYLGVSTTLQISKILRRSESEVQAKISSLGQGSHSGSWNREEIQQLKALYGSRADEDLAKILGRPLVAIRRQASSLRLAKDKVFLRQSAAESSRMPRWAREEEATLAKLYPDHSNLEIARILKRSVKSVVSKAHDLQLKKDPGRLVEMGRENVSLREDR